MKIFSYFLRCLFFFLIILADSAPANSIYSRHGIGLLRYRNGVKTIGMGSVSIAIADSLALSFLNPANLASVSLTRVQGDFLYERASINLRGGSGLFHDANVNALGISIPVKRGYVFALGIQPYSRSSFQFSQSDSADSYEEIFHGSGGLNDVNLAFAATLGPVRVGIAADFYFGQIERVWRVNYASQGRRNSEDVTSNYLKGLGLHAGLQSQFGRWLIGAAAGLPTRLNVETTQTTATGFRSDTVESKLRLPLWWGVGLGYTPDRHWFLGVDWRSQRWSTVKPEELLGDPAVDSYEIGFGAEVIPSFDALDGFFKRLSYRFGGSFRQLPYEEPIGNKLREWTASFGLGLPFGRGFNRIDLALEIGKRGSLSTNVAAENIVLLHASVTGSERWFQRGPRR